MNLIPLAHLPFKLKLHLFRGLLRSHNGRDIQKSQARKLWNTALNTVWIGNRLPEHLIASANTDYESTVSMSANDSLSHTISSQFVKVIESGFCAGNDNNVSLLKVLYVIGIEEIDARITLKNVEICKVTDMP